VPKSEWINFVTTGKAKSKLLTKFRKENKEVIKKGEDILLEYLSKHNIAVEQKVYDILEKKFGAENREDFLMKVGTKEIDLSGAESYLKTDKNTSKLVRYWKEAFGSGKQQNKPETPPQKTEGIDLKNTFMLTEDSLQQTCHLADCCQPIPGDDVVGFLEDSGFISVHKRQCTVAMGLKSSYGSRIVSVVWATHKELSFPAAIELRGIDQVGLVSQVARIVSDEMAVNMTKVLFETRDGIFKGSIELYVHDLEDLQNLCRKLSAIKSIQSVIRHEKI
jgi:GTP pyrophosphokinase